MKTSRRKHLRSSPWPHRAAALALLLGTACASPLPAPPPDAIVLRPDVWLQPLAPDVWRHVSFHSFPGGVTFPSNGLIVRAPGGALVVDTAWNPEQTAAVLDWGERELGGVQGLIVTHAHNDRLGGLSEVRARAIPSYALARTAQLAGEQGGPAIEQSVPSGFTLAEFGIEGEVFFPGAAHTVDNATVWLATPRLLAGGCMLRALDTDSLGNTSQADLESWPVAVAALQARYPTARLVVPGHGDPAGAEILAHTRMLLAR